MRRILPVVALAAMLAGCSYSESPELSAAATAKAAPAGAAANRALDLASVRARLVRGERYASLPDRGQLLSYVGGGTAQFRTRAYAWKQVELSEQHALAAIGGVMTLQSPEGHLIRLRYDHHIEHANGD